MESSESSQKWSELIAAAADVCFKPWRHGVVIEEGSQLPDSLYSLFNNNEEQCPFELVVRIESRDADGDRYPDRDLELELYRSGDELNLILSWAGQPQKPILWQGQHPVWMNGTSGERCTKPVDGGPLESLARRIRSIMEVSITG